MLGLERRDGMHGVGATDLLWRRFGEAEETDLARGDEPGYGADGPFDGRARIDAVLIREIDGVYAEALQRGVAGGANNLGLAVDAGGAERRAGSYSLYGAARRGQAR